jgi:hypothetical protein
VEAPSDDLGRGLRVQSDALRGPLAGNRLPRADPSPVRYWYVKIGSPMSIQLKIASAFGIGTLRHPWLAG